MKTSTIPPLRVAPELRAAAESVLGEGETLSAFVESSLRAGIAQRRLRQEFVARGLQSRDEARLSGVYFPADEVHAALDAMLLAAEERAKYGK